MVLVSHILLKKSPSQTSDENGTLSCKYGVIKLKKMYGTEFEEIERSTFLINTKGALRQEWRKVKVPGQLLDAAKHLN